MYKDEISVINTRRSEYLTKSYIENKSINEFFEKKENAGGDIIYYETEKLILLVPIKTGIKIIYDILEPILIHNKEGLQSFFNISSNLYKNIDNNKRKFYQLSNQAKNEFKELDNYLNGESKKDLIILYRDPRFKFLSGCIQDKKTRKELEDDFKSGIELFDGHRRLYGEWMYNFIIHNPKINKSKLHLLDIDGDIDIFKYLQEWHPEIKKRKLPVKFSTNRHNWNVLIYDLLESENHGFVAYVRSKIQTELQYYYNLKRQFNNSERKYI